MIRFLLSFFVKSHTKEVGAFNAFASTTASGRAKMLLAAHEGLDKEMLWVELKEKMDRRTFDLVCDNARLGNLLDVDESSYLIGPDNPTTGPCSCCRGPGPWRTLNVRLDNFEVELLFCAICEGRTDIVEGSTPALMMMPGQREGYFSKEFLNYMVSGINVMSFDQFKESKHE